jgi:ABC-type phosphate transport system substrate-binding protein
MKKSIKTLALAAGLLAAAGSAQALDINIYGSSAQFEMLSAIANNILTSSTVGCSGTTQQTQIGTYFAINGTAAGTGPCASGITLRIANKSSSDGIKALVGSAGAAPCSSITPTAPYVANNYRQFINPGDTTTPASTDTTKCQPITLAASDVAYNTFAETSNGCEFGPVYALNPALGTNVYSCGPAPTKSCATTTGTSACYYTNKTASAIGLNGVTLINKSPMIFPFAFWANNTLQVNKCSAADANAGSLCDPGTGSGCATASNCTAQPLDGLSRIQAVNIFSGTVTSLADFGTAYTSTSPTAGLSIRVCQRHAGSGTEATLNQAVMNSGKWGKALTTDPDSSCNPTAGTWPSCLPMGSAMSGATLGAYTFFVDSSDDLMNCVSSVDNAIGIVDADACNPSGSNASSFLNNPGNTNAYNYNMCANVHVLNYNGYAPTRINVRNGLYELWAKEQLYSNGTINSATSAVGKFFTAFVGAINPAFINATNVGQSASIWASVSEMNYSKTDPTYPAFNGGAQTPQLP